MPTMFRPAARCPLPGFPFQLAVLLLTFQPGSARSQATPGSPGPAASTPAKTQKVADLAARYRFSERFTTDEKVTGPGMVGSYRVAIRDLIRDSNESLQAAPKKTETNRQVIYSERPAEIVAGGSGAVTSSTRVVEKYQVKSEDATKMMGSRPLEGATILLRPKVGELPLILCLTKGRTLTEYEFDVLTKQAFVPHLSALLPTSVVRLGDTWRITRKATQALLGDPAVSGDTLMGKLTEIRKEVDGPRMVATMTISGRVAVAGGDMTVNAELLFTFQPWVAPKNPAKKVAPPPGPMEDVMEARGALTELRLASITSGPLAGPARLRFQSNRELTLHRQLGVADASLMPPLVEKPPEPIEANAWLTHVNSSGRYSLRHPQEMLQSGPGQLPADPKTISLVRTRREGRDMLQVEFFEKTLTPEDLKKEMADKYKTLKMEVLKGDEAWLPEVQWPGMRVHRIDAAVKVADPKSIGYGGSARIHFDGYLIQFAQSASILAIASTSREAVAPFRQEVEQILKSLQLDPPRSISD